MTEAAGLDDLDVSGKRVLVRADLNVPLRGGRVADDFRITASLETIQQLRASGALVVVCSHLGRPDGPDPGLSMEPVGLRLAELGGFEVAVADDVAGPSARTSVEKARDEVVLLENTRFESGETSNDDALADELAGLADVFVFDAFASAHRAHASTVGVANRLRSAAGRLVQRECESLGRLKGEGERPYVVAIGGAKVSGKLGVIRALLPQVDAMLVGGGMCFTLLAAENYEVGESLVEESMIDEVRTVLATEDGGKVILPVDIRLGAAANAETVLDLVDASEIPRHAVGLDIGPRTAERFRSIIGNAERLFWNGPMGVFEVEAFRRGTEALAAAVAECPGFTVVGGGDSVAAMRQIGREDEVSHLSTGGGAALVMLEGGELPALSALERDPHGA